MNIRTWLSIALVAMVILGAVPSADAHSGRRTVNVPSHFTVADHYYNGTLGGLRQYMESVRETNPELYAKLTPDLDRLQARQLAAGAVLTAGVLAGAGTMIYGFATRLNCVDPTLGDPNFGLQIQQSAACNENNMQRVATFSLIGFGALAVGMVAAMAIVPSRYDYFDFMNRHNGMSPQPIRFNLGYDPQRRFALAGATLTF